MIFFKCNCSILVLLEISNIHFIPVCSNFVLIVKPLSHITAAYTMIVIAQQGAYFVNKWGRAVKRPFADKAAAVQCIAKHAKSLPVEGGGCVCNEQTEGVNRGSAVYGNPSVNPPCGVLPAPRKGEPFDVVSKLSRSPCRKAGFHMAEPYFTLRKQYFTLRQQDFTARVSALSLPSTPS